MPTIGLPRADRRIESFVTSAPRTFAYPQRPFSRVAYAAAHVVADPWTEAAIDWARTITYRRYLWSLGPSVAEAMDTAQRGMGLDWPTSLALIHRSLEAARDVPGAMIACGAGTDHLAPGPHVHVDDVIRAYEEQCEAVEVAGGRIILMASRALAASARNADDYRRVYGRILAGVREPVIIHWLGAMFDPALAGYWGADDLAAAMRTCLDVIAANAAKVDGIKLSLLDDRKEVAMRRLLGIVLMAWLNGHQDHFVMVGGQQSARSLLHLCELFRLADGAGLLADPERACARMRLLLASHGVD
jgi:hypothetical protein